MTGQTSLIQHFDQELDDLQPNPAEAKGENVGRSNIIARTSGSESGRPMPQE